MRSLASYSKDYYAGALMVLIGLWAVIGGMRYDVGTLERIGPGFFPVAVGALLALVGVAIAVGADPAVRETGFGFVPEWRGWSGIIGGILAFIGLGYHGGLVPATFALVFISAMGDRQTTLRQAVCLAAGMVVVSVILFRWALRLQLPLFRWG